MISFISLLEISIKDDLRKIYFDITGAGEEIDYERSYKRIVKFLKQAVEGGKLQHFRPKNGITLYRGYKDIRFCCIWFLF